MCPYSVKPVKHVCRSVLGDKGTQYPECHRLRADSSNLCNACLTALKLSKIIKVPLKHPPHEETHAGPDWSKCHLPVMAPFLFYTCLVSSSVIPAVDHSKGIVRSSFCYTTLLKRIQPGRNGCTVHCIACPTEGASGGRQEACAQDVDNKRRFWIFCLHFLSAEQEETAHDDEHALDKT